MRTGQPPKPRAMPDWTHPVRVYLSGSVRRGVADERLDAAAWTATDEAEIRSVLGQDVIIYNPSSLPVDRSDWFAHFGCDLYYVWVSDVMLLNGAAPNGIGTGAEMMWARQANVPIIAIAPPGSPYRQPLLVDVCGQDLPNWTHPFLAGLCSLVVETLGDALTAIRQLSRDELVREAPPVPEEAMDYYLRYRSSVVPDGERDHTSIASNALTGLSRLS
jgi:hypothetical protein